MLPDSVVSDAVLRRRQSRRRWRLKNPNYNSEWKKRNRESHRASNNKWNATNRGRVNEMGYKSRAARLKELQQVINRTKADAGCRFCGEAEPCALDFHHRDPASKEFSIGQASKNVMAVGRVLLEIAKCEVVRASCHRKLHAGLLALPAESEAA